MSNSEDYLDHLLDLLSLDEKARSVGLEDFDEMQQATLEDDLLKSFSEEMPDLEETDDFLEEFERELMGQMQNEDIEGNAPIVEEKEPEEVSDPLPDDLESLINGMKNQMESGEEFEEIDNALEAGIPDALMTDDALKLADRPLETMDNLMVNTMDEENAFEPESGEDDLMALLKSDDIFSDIESMLQADEKKESLNDESLFENFAADSIGEIESLLNDDQDLTEEIPEETNDKTMKKQKKSKGEKAGFIEKLGSILFGDDEGKEKEVEKVSVAPVAASIEDLSDENLALLKELTDASEPEPEPVAEEPKKDTKKKEKKPKPKKEKKPKPKKVKKPKPPAEPDNTPPLPKAPVFLTFVMAASILILVMLGTNLLGYQSGFSNAKRAYEQADYCEAFRQVSGMEIKDADMNTYEKYRIMALVTSEYESYQSMMSAEQYDIALDSLIRAAGRCNKYSADAETYGCAKEFGQMNAKILDELTNRFGVSEEDALGLYAYGEEREEYSIQIYTILENIGLEKVTEE